MVSDFAARPRLRASTLLTVVYLALTWPNMAQVRAQDRTPQQEDVRFSSDLAATLAERCAGCHGGNRPRSGLRIESFRTLMEGGESGPVVIPGDAANSLLVRKMKGEADGDRMPPRGDPIGSDLIGQFAAWIEAGANFDLGDTSTDLETLASRSTLERLSAEQLREAAEVKVREKWALAYSGDEPTMVSTPNFLLVASKSTVEVEDVGAQLEKAFGKSTKQLGVGKPAVKSPFVVYLIPKNYDFGEWIQMVEKRSLRSNASKRYWMPDSGFGYLVLGPKSSVSPKSRRRGPPSFVSDAEVMRFVTSLILNRWGAPQWYSEGLGQVALERANPRDPMVAVWKGNAKRAVRTAKNAKAVFGAEQTASDAAATTWALAKSISRNTRRLRDLHHKLAAGTDFENAFETAFGRSFEDMVEIWLAGVKRVGKR